MKKALIAIVVEGGIVKTIVSNSKVLVGKEFMVIDYDVQDDDTVAIDQGDGTTSDAHVYRSTIDNPGIDLTKAYKALLEKEKDGDN